MSLIYDSRPTLGASPATHALIVGISDYDLSYMQLSSAAKSADAVAGWLQTHDMAVPLATCRALCSPPDRMTSGKGASSATIDNFLRAASEWRADAATHQDNIALFYFCGHGFQRSPQDDVLLFSDFGSPVGPALRASVSVDNIFRGMAPRPGEHEMARTQLYFVDTSRDLVSDERYQFSRPTMVFDELAAGPDDRSAIIFYATGPGQQAYSKIDEVSVFTSALLRCLDGEAAVAVDNSLQHWGVTVNSLVQGLQRIIGENPLLEGRKQAPVVGGLVRDRNIRYLDSAPTTALVVNVSPTVGFSTVSLQDATGKVVYTSPVDHQNKAQFNAKSGLYLIQAQASDGTPLASILANLQPGLAEVRLGPL